MDSGTVVRPRREGMVAAGKRGWTCPCDGRGRSKVVEDVVVLGDEKVRAVTLEAWGWRGSSFEAMMSKT